MTIEINKEQRVYLIPSDKGFKILNFNVCKKCDDDLRKELDLPQNITEIGTLAAYKSYLTSLSIARLRFDKSFVK